MKSNLLNKRNKKKEASLRDGAYKHTNVVV